MINIRYPMLSLAVMKKFAATPSGKAELRQMRDQLLAGRAKLVDEYEGRLAQADKVLADMNLALGEVQA